MNSDLRNERLRRRLREADPAAGETGLTTEEVREMRRTVLTAVPEPRRRFTLSPALAGAAMAVLAAIVVLAMWPRPEPSRPQPPAPIRIAVKKPVTDVKSADVKRPAETVAADLRARRPATPAKEPDRLSAVGAVAQGHQEEPERRQIQFDTPGGTRVIWILTSGNAL